MKLNSWIDRGGSCENSQTVACVSVSPGCHADDGGPSYGVAVVGDEDLRNVVVFVGSLEKRVGQSQTSDHLSTTTTKFVKCVTTT